MVVFIEEKLEGSQRLIRHGDNLCYTHQLQLIECITGYEFTFSQLDGRVLVIRSPPNTITVPGMCVCVCV